MKLAVVVAATWLAACGVATPPLAPPPHRATETTTVSLPPRGRVHSALLADGDPVWVVRTEDDDVRVLAASVRTFRRRYTQKDDGWTVLRVDGSTQWRGIIDRPFPGGYLAATEDPAQDGYLGIDHQPDPDVFR